MQFSESINLDIPKSTKNANNDSSLVVSDTSSSDDESSITIYPFDTDAPLKDTTSFNIIMKTHETTLFHRLLRQKRDRMKQQ